MTPPSLTVAREILTDDAAKARTSGDPVAELAAAAIDVVLAELDRRPSVHGDASVITVSAPAAATAPAAILLGCLPGVQQIRSREEARKAFGRQDGDAVWDAFGRAPAPVFLAAVPEVPAAGRCSTCGAALPLSPGRPGCAECHEP